MSRKLKLRRKAAILGAVLAALAAVAVAAPGADARVRPFLLVEHGTARFDSPTSISSTGSGVATYLGRFTLQRSATLYDPRGSVSQVDGEARLTTADGEELDASIEGTFDAATGKGRLFYEWEGGTGRFAHATGTTIWQVTLKRDDLTYSVFAYGVIDL